MSLPKNKLSGFTMVEVMAAMLILAIVCVAYSENQVSAIQLVKATRFRDTAVMLAQQRMAEVNFLVQSRGVEEIKEDERGDFDSEKFEGYTWHITKKMVPAPDFSALLSAAGAGDSEESGGQQQPTDLSGPMKMIMDAWGKSIMEVKLEVLWKEGEQEKSYSIMTHFMASNANAQIQGVIGGLAGAAAQAGGGAQ
ncbi:MAG: prepilin-type N-terminal cleavage/methylation domain-containing protein [Bdellovibrionota bacterium]